MHVTNMLRSYNTYLPAPLFLPVFGPYYQRNLVNKHSQCLLSLSRDTCLADQKTFLGPH